MRELDAVQRAHHKIIQGRSVTSGALEKQDPKDRDSAGLALEKARLESLADAVAHVSGSLIQKQGALEADVEQIKADKAERDALPWYKRILK